MQSNPIQLPHPPSVASAQGSVSFGGRSRSNSNMRPSLPGSGGSGWGFRPSRVASGGASYNEDEENGGASRVTIIGGKEKSTSASRPLLSKAKSKGKMHVKPVTKPAGKDSKAKPKSSLDKLKKQDMHYNTSVTDVELFGGWDDDAEGDGDGDGLSDGDGFDSGCSPAEVFNLHRVHHPESRLRRITSILAALAACYTILAIPFEIAFQPPLSAGILTLDGFSDIVFGLHLFISLRTAFYREGILINDLSEISKKCWSSRGFVVHVITNIPFDWLAIGFLYPSYYTFLLRIPKITRLQEILAIFRGFEKSLQFNPGVVRVTKMLFFVVVFAHWLGCMWFLLSVIQGPDADSWVRHLGLDDKPISKQYIYSVYFCITVMTTVGFGDITAQSDIEHIFVMFVMLSGASMYAAVSGNMANIMASLDQSAVRYRQKVEVLQEYMKYRGLPENLKMKILQYYEVLWSRHGGLDENIILKDMPGTLRSEVSLYMNKELVERVALFKDCDAAGFMNALVVLLKPHVAIPGEYVIREGDLGHEMYFIKRGTLDVVSEEDDVVFGQLKEDQYFGEIALLFECRRTASIRASSYCDLLILCKKDFDKVLQFYPGYHEKMRQTALGIIKQKLQAALREADLSDLGTHTTDPSMIPTASPSISAMSGRLKVDSPVINPLDPNQSSLRHPKPSFTPYQSDANEETDDGNRPHPLRSSLIKKSSNPPPMLQIDQDIPPLSRAGSANMDGFPMTSSAFNMIDKIAGEYSSMRTDVRLMPSLRKEGTEGDLLLPPEIITSDADTDKPYDRRIEIRPVDLSRPSFAPMSPFMGGTTYARSPFLGSNHKNISPFPAATLGVPKPESLTRTLSNTSIEEGRRFSAPVNDGRRDSDRPRSAYNAKETATRGRPDSLLNTSPHSNRHRYTGGATDPRSIRRELISTIDPRLIQMTRSRSRRNLGGTPEGNQRRGSAGTSPSRQTSDPRISILEAARAATPQGQDSANRAPRQAAPSSRVSSAKTDTRPKTETEGYVPSMYSPQSRPGSGGTRRQQNLRSESNGHIPPPLSVPVLSDGIDQSTPVLKFTPRSVPNTPLRNETVAQQKKDEQKTEQTTPIAIKIDVASPSLPILTDDFPTKQSASTHKPPLKAEKVSGPTLHTPTYDSGNEGISSGTSDNGGADDGGSVGPQKATSRCILNDLVTPTPSVMQERNPTESEYRPIAQSPPNDIGQSAARSPDEHRSPPTEKTHQTARRISGPLLEVQQLQHRPGMSRSSSIESRGETNPAQHQHHPQQQQQQQQLQQQQNERTSTRPAAHPRMPSASNFGAYLMERHASTSSYWSAGSADTRDSNARQEGASLMRHPSEYASAPIDESDSVAHSYADFNPIDANTSLMDSASKIPKSPAAAYSSSDSDD